jgi:hypothetical protein
MQVSNPRRVTHSYTQSLAAPPEKVFPLLCPVREADWVPGWDPELVLSNSGVAEKDCIFITRDNSQESIWIITCFEPDKHKLEMIKVTPGHTVGKLEIQLTPAADNQTAAEIAYTYTALGPEGDHFLNQFTAQWYKTFMHNWERAINHYLSTGTKLSV